MVISFQNHSSEARNAIPRSLRHLYVEKIMCEKAIVRWWDAK